MTTRKDAMTTRKDAMTNRQRAERCADTGTRDSTRGLVYALLALADAINAASGTVTK